MEPTRTPATEQGSVKLLPCPFCGCIGTVTRPKWKVMCINCNAEGPQRVTNHEAKAAWNHRTPSVADCNANPTTQQEDKSNGEDYTTFNEDYGQ